MKTFLKYFIISIWLFVGSLTANSQEIHRVSSTVEFVIGTDSFIRNSDYDYFVNELIPYIRSNSNDIDEIVLIGSASPEGNAHNNIYLANIRAEKVYSYIKNYVPKCNVIINNNYSLFLKKTGLNETDYSKLRAVYIEINTRPKKIETHTDTVYVEKRDTVIYEIVNNYYSTNIIENGHNSPVFAVYNDLFSDALFRLNMGAEVYFNKMSFFLEGSFSNWNFIGKIYNIDLWHCGLRKYFNDDYNKFFIEGYANYGYFDTDIFGDIGKIGIFYGGGIGLGYAFDLCSHWKIGTIIRIGLFERIYYSDYYYTGNGNINVQFDNYVNGKIDENGNFIAGSTENKVITVNKTITKEFFENSTKAYYMGPTYIGLFLKKDFCIYNKTKHKK